MTGEFILRGGNHFMQRGPEIRWVDVQGSSRTQDAALISVGRRLLPRLGHPFAGVRITRHLSLMYESFDLLQVEPFSHQES